MGLLAAVVVAYIPVWWAGYVWDDDDLLTNNPCIIGPLGLTDIWTSEQARICPFVLTTFWLEHALWGLSALPYHIVNVLMHGGAAIVLWRVLVELRIPGAWLGAALWALHPMQVETVAWIAEMKNTESGLFFFLTILFFIRWMKGEQQLGTIYGLILLSAFLALASKSSTVVLPVVLAMVAWWMTGRFDLRTLIVVAPTVLLACIPVVVSVWTQNAGGNLTKLMARPWSERFITAGDAVWFYLGKMLWPHPLEAMYLRWQIDTGSVLAWLPVIALTTVFVCLVIWRKSWSRPWLMALGYFVVVLLPVLGFVNHYFMNLSFVGDHFAYLALAGPLALIGAGMALLAERVPAVVRPIGAGALLTLLAALTWNHAWTYQSDIFLWKTTVEQEPDAWPAHQNLANALYKQRHDASEILAEYRIAARINPTDAPVITNLGLTLLATGSVDEGVEQLHRAVQLEPYRAVMHYNLATGLLGQGKQDEAMAELNEALRVNPKYGDARNNLGNELLKEGKTDEALAQFQKTVELDPTFSDAINNIGLIYLRSARFTDAEAQFRRAAQIDPNNDMIHLNLGDALVQQNRIADAITEFEKAYKLNPRNDQALNNLLATRNMLQQGAAQH